MDSDSWTDLAEHGVPLLVLGRAAPGPGVLPVQVQAVEAVGPQEADGGLDEPLAVGRGGHHDGKPGDTRAAGHVFRTWIAFIK